MVPAGCRIDDPDFPDWGEFIQHAFGGQCTALAGQMPVEQRLQHQGQYADEDMNADFLVCAVILWTDCSVAGILEIAECALDMVLGPVALDNLRIAQAAAVGEDQVLAEQCLLQAFPGLVVKAVGQSGNIAGRVVKGGPKQFFHVLGLEAVVHLFPGRGHDRGAVPGDEPCCRRRSCSWISRSFRLHREISRSSVAACACARFWFLATRTAYSASYTRVTVRQTDTPWNGSSSRNRDWGTASRSG